MQKLVRIFLGLALIAAVVGGWWVLFPSPERVIRKQLKGLSETVSFDGKDGTIVKGFKAQKLLDYLTADVQIDVNVREYPAHTFTGRDEVMQALLFAQSNLKGLQVKFLDVNVTLGADKQTAVANLTAQANIAGDRDFNIQELNFSLKKVDGKWMIYKIETVKTLSQTRPIPTVAAHDA
jgi:hypothetical protein